MAMLAVFMFLIVSFMRKNFLILEWKEAGFLFASEDR